MRLIDLDTLLQFLESQNCANDWLVNMYNADWIASWLESQPIIEVDVVRCKDCKHRVEPTKMCAHPKAIGWDAIEPDDDAFCSYGVRRDDT